MKGFGQDNVAQSPSEKVASVLRENRDSVMTVLEPFVYDPLINWRLLQRPQQDEPAVAAGADAAWWYRRRGQCCCSQ
jgi:phosphatidylinositol kinase/protein kinase (PI-3  family)